MTDINHLFLLNFGSALSQKIRINTVSVVEKLRPFWYKFFTPKNIKRSLKEGTQQLAGSELLDSQLYCSDRIRPRQDQSKKNY